MKRECRFFLLGALSVIALRAYANLAVTREDGRRRKERAQKDVEEEDLEMLDEGIYNEEW
jgi:hypothetical protein